MKTLSTTALWIGILFCLLLGTAYAADNKAPKFRDYPATEIFHGTPASLKLATATEREFRTRLRAAMAQKADFAGKYTLVTWGCGAGCLMGAAVNLKTGDVRWLPGTLSQSGTTFWDEGHMPLTYQLGSRLMVIFALRNEKTSDEGKVHFYYLDDKKGFQYIKSVPKG